MREIQEDIRSGQFQKIYLLYGEETYLLKQYRDRLKDALLAGADNMNLNRYTGKETKIGQIIDMAETLPFFAARRVIILENTSWFKTGGEELAVYLQTLAETTFFIFVESEIDKRGKLYKTVAKLGRVTEFGRQSEDVLMRWILSMVKKENKQITAQTLHVFLEHTGNDMQNIYQEFEKLLCFCMKEESITTEHVEKICTQQVTNQIFKMTDAMTEGNSKKVMKFYYDMIELQESPLYILSMITRHFNLLLQIKDLMQRGSNKKDIMSDMKMSSFQVDIYTKQSKAFSLNYLKKAFTDCVETDYKIKSGLLDMKVGVETLLVQYSVKPS